MPEFIYRDSTPIAEPAFRILAYWTNPMGTPEISAGLAQLFDCFIQYYGQGTAWSVIADDQRPYRPEEVTPERIADARDWLKNAAKPWPSSCRFVGPVNEQTGQISVPAFRAEQVADLCFLDMSVPDDLTVALPFAEAASEILKRMPVLYAVAGMGFHLPPALESLETYLPRASARYKTAIEFMAEGARWGLHEEVGNFRWDRVQGARSGLPDIGWRTFVGKHFLDRLPDLDQIAQVEGIAYERGDMLAVITAGQTPIWGDVNAPEDISLYQVVAQALRPVRMHIEPALSGLFGSQTYDPDGRDRVEAYLARLD